MGLCMLIKLGLRYSTRKLELKTKDQRDLFDHMRYKIKQLDKNNEWALNLSNEFIITISSPIERTLDKNSTVTFLVENPPKPGLTSRIRSKHSKIMLYGWKKHKNTRKKR